MRSTPHSARRSSMNWPTVLDMPSGYPAGSRADRTGLSMEAAGNASGMPEIVVITGASAGVGRATAREFGARGAHVALIARGRAGLEAAAAEVRASGGTALVLPCD